MRQNPVAIAASAAVLFVVGIVLWPPTDVLWQWWTILPDSMRGDLLLLALLLVPSVAVGVGLTGAGGVRRSELAIGGLLAYAVGMGLIGIAIEPDSPAHFLLYGTILVGVLLGAVGGNAIGAERGDVAEDHTESV